LNPALVVLDEQGKPFTVRCEQVNAMLLNEFLKEHRTVQAEQKGIEAPESGTKRAKSVDSKGER
jgi:hypothetical protein